MAAREFALDHDNVYWTYGVHPEETGRLEVCFSRDFGGCCREGAPEPREDGREGRDPEEVLFLLFIFAIWCDIIYISILGGL